MKESKVLGPKDAQQELENQTTEQQKEIAELHEKVYLLQEELMALRNARLLGKIINAREFVGGKALPAIRALPKRSIGLTKTILLYYVPEKHKKRLVETKHRTRSKLKHSLHKMRYGSRSLQVTVLKNTAWPRAYPIISIVVPYYNRASTVDATLESLARQTYKNFEVIVVDDGSNDRVSAKKCQQLPAQYPSLNIRVLEQSNAGVAAARNNGIQQAQGKYIICLDPDDLLTPAYIEKCLLVLEANPDVSLVTTLREDFGALRRNYDIPDYDPLRLFSDNVVVTAAAFRKDAWERAGGYRSGIGYEDWDYWLTLAENGDWGVTIREPLFKYRVAIQSRFIEDKGKHFDTLRAIRHLHPGYRKRISKITWEKAHVQHVVAPESAFINLSSQQDYIAPTKPAVLITMPWMTFGGAETLTYNYCYALKNDFEVSFITGLPSANEWDYKFRDITNRIYHLPQLFKDEKLYLEFVSLYIRTRQITVLHIVHNGFMFDMLPEIKKRHPHLKIVATMFNDRVPQYVEGVIERVSYIDQLVTDSQAVAESFKLKTNDSIPVRIIPNGVDCLGVFNPELYDRKAMRDKLGLEENDKAVFFIGRLSEEKNPIVFVEAAKKVLNDERSADKYTFFIIGNGPEYPKLERAVYKAKNKRIVVLGYKRDVAKYLAAADIFVLPSSIEGFPLSIIEAMAMGVAVVASSVGAIPDVIKDGAHGYVVVPGSAQAIYEALLKLGDERVLEQIKHNNSKDAGGKYSLDRLASSYKQLYKDMTE